jgi:hypothetical protein
MNAHLGLGALLQALALAPAAADPAEDGAASEKAGRLREAIDHYRSALSQSLAESSEEFVLLEKTVTVARRLQPRPVVPREAKPDAPDARKVKELIYEIEYRAEDAVRTPPPNVAAKPDLSALAGRWRVLGYWGGRAARSRSGAAHGVKTSAAALRCALT